MNAIHTPTIVFTGGHPTPAIAVIEAMRHLHPSWKIVWVGRTYTFEATRVFSSEYTWTHEQHIPFIPLTTGRLQRSISLQTIPSLLKFPIGLIQSFTILHNQKPTCVMSFGGYIALPVAIAAYIMRIPVVTHEQTHTLGLSNTIIGWIAKKICLSFPDTLKTIPKEKGILTGLPIRSELFTPPDHPSFSVPKDHAPCIYITGGSTGAQTLNDQLFPMIPKLLETCIVIHQTGDISFEKAKKMKNPRYIIAPYFQTNDVAWILHKADVVIGRSGANTVAELSACGKKALLIPLPWSGAKEQEKNAIAYAKTGNAIVMHQDAITEKLFFEDIDTLLKQKSPKPVGTSSTSAHAVVQVIESCLNDLCRE